MTPPHNAQENPVERFAVEKSSIIERLLQTPQATAAAAALKKEVAEQRARLAAHRERLELQAEENYHKHDAALKSAVAEHRKAVAAVAAAAATISSLQAARAGEVARFDMEITAVERSLRESADAAIDEFITDARDLWEKAFKEPFPQANIVKRNPNTGEKQIAAGQPLVTPPMRIKAIRAAIAAAEALKLQADQSKIAAQLTELLLSIPKVGDLVV